MATLQTGQSVTLQVTEGESWTVTPTLQAQISSRGVSGGPLTAPATISAATTYGPFNESGTLTITALRGSCDYAGSELSSLVSGAGTPVLNGANAGQDSGWVPYAPGMRLAYALDSGSTSTTFSVDISADGSTSLGQAFTGTWASTTAEISPPIWLSNPAARFIRFNVLTGGPLSVVRF